MEAKWVVNGLTDSVGGWSSDIRGLSNDHDDNDRHKSNKGNRFFARAALFLYISLKSLHDNDFNLLKFTFL